MKVCTKCRRELPHEKYYTRGDGKKGLKSICRDCVNLRAKNRKAEQPAKWKEYWSEYSKIHKDKINDRVKKSLVGDDAKAQAAREYRLRYRQEHEDYYREKQREWRATHPGYSYDKNIRRRAREKDSEGEFTRSEFRDLCASYGNRCLRCGITGVELTADHVIPITKGGSSWITNIQPLCRSCNSRKSNRHIDYRPQERENAN